MDALQVTLTPHGWIALPLGPWAEELGPGPGSHVSPGGATPLELIAQLSRVVPPHVVLVLEP